MADRQITISNPDQSHQLTGRTVLTASIAGIIVGGPLLGMMGFSFLATLTLLLITSPLLIIFSPLLFFAGVVLLGAVAGFAAAGAMAFAGISTLSWILREVRGNWEHCGSVTEFKEKAKEWAGYSQQKAQQ